MKQSNSILLSSIILMLAACGGGGGGGGGSGGDNNGGSRDTTPNAFVFTDQTGAPLDTVILSNTVTVSGINAAVNISINVGEYSINSGAFTSNEGTVRNGDTVTVRVTSPASFSASVHATVGIGGVSDEFSVTTLAMDTTPDPFTFIDQTDVEPDTEFLSNAVTITGINSPAIVQISNGPVGNGQYSVNGGPFIAFESTVVEGDQIVIRQDSAPGFSGTTTTTLTIGGVSESFVLVTEALDAVPDAFTFIDQTDAILNTQFTSNAVTVTGTNATSSISITGGQYSVNGGAFTSNSLLALPGDSIVVRQTSAGTFSTTTDTVLTIEGVSDTFSVTTMAPGSAPAATIIFPTAESLTDAESITVRGTAADDSEISYIRVNGLDVVTTDGFANWSITLPLSEGMNALTVETGDVLGNQEPVAAQAFVDRGALLVDPNAIVMDGPNNRLLITDEYHGHEGVVAVDLATGVRSRVSGGGTGTGPSFEQPVDLAMDGANNRVLVLDRQLAAVIAVDISEGVNKGMRTVISGHSSISGPLTGGGPGLGAADVIALDTNNGRALVMRATNLYGVNLASGERTLITTVGAFLNPEGLVYDSGGKRALVFDALDNDVYAVNLDDESPLFGNSGVVADYSIGAGPALVIPRGLQYDSANNRVLVTDYSTGSLVAISLADGNRTTVSDAGTGMGSAFINPIGVYLDAGNDRALVLDAGLDGVVSVNLDVSGSGDRTLVTSARTGAGPQFRLPRAMTFDFENGRAWVTDRDGDDALFEVDLSGGPANGDQAIIASTNLGIGGGTDLVDPRGLIFDSANDRVLIVDDNRDRVVAVDVADGPAKGDRSDLAQHFLIGYDIALDSVNNRALIVDRTPGAVISADLGGGAITVISNETEGSGPELGNPEALVLDGDNNRVLVANRFYSSLSAVNLDTGDRTVISDDSTGNGPTLAIFEGGIALDSVNNRILAGRDGTDPALISIDLSSGDRTIIADAVTGIGPDFNPWDLEMDVANNRLFVLDGVLDAILTVDLTSGERVISAK
jgi:hypothetical protein